MQITLELDEKTVENKDKLSDKEVSQMYAEAYRKHLIQPDEFEIEDRQMEEFWKMVSL